jgi:hypothetical protein
MKKNIKYLVFAIAVIICSSVVAQKPTFHAIIFTCTNDENIGKSCSIDNDHILDEIGIITSSLDYVYDKNIYTGKDCNPENIYKVISSLKCGPKDIVFFYYSGHGTRTDIDNSPYPRMCLNQQLNQYENMITLEEVDQKIASKNPLTRFVFADCCNILQIRTKSNYSKSLTRGAESTTIEEKIADNYKKLFSNVRGNIISAACKSNETASGYEYVDSIPIGGIYTYCLLQYIDHAVAGDIECSWETILSKTTKAVAEIEESGISAHEQHPIYNINLNSINNQNSNNEDINPVHVIGDPLLADMMNLLDHSMSVKDKLKATTSIKNKYFYDDNAIVDVLGYDNKTIVDRETVNDFLQRIALSNKLINIVILKELYNNNKITHLVVHEIYKK